MKIYRYTGRTWALSDGLRHARQVAFALVGIAALAGCPSDKVSSDDRSSDVSNAHLFRVSEPLEVELEIPEDDWTLLRHEGRSVSQVFSGCRQLDFEYTYVQANASVDGVATEGVAVRKKGFLGSLSTRRPSFRVDYGREGHDGRLYEESTRRFTLNNNRQDPSNARQCLAYGLFEQVGLPAPRCGLAHVTVGDLDLGYYTNVEPIKKRFLRRAFGDDSGNLYELALSDFDELRIANFEKKTNKDLPNGPELKRVLDVLAVDDDALLAELGKVFDVDELFTFWAMEVLTGHWDGWFGDLNNTYLYYDPRDELFHPIPWGTDATFTEGHSLVDNVGSSVYAHNAIGRRIYGIPEGRDRYHARLRELMADVWDEEALLASLQDIVDVTDADPEAVAEVRDFIENRRKNIEEELKMNGGVGPDIESAVSESRACKTPEPVALDFSFDFDAKSDMGYLPLREESALELDVPLLGGTLEVDWDAEAPLGGGFFADDGQVQIAAVVNDAVSGKRIFVGFFIPKDLYKTGTIPMHGFETLGLVAVLEPSGGFRIVGWIGEGDLTLESADQNSGGKVTGSFRGRVSVSSDQ